MKKSLFVLLPLALTLGCAGGPGTGGAPPVPDTAIGLAAGTAFEQPAQTAIGFNTADPGESELRPRPNEQFPPVIPHSAGDLETISRDENQCMDCHEPEAAADLDAPAIPSSHTEDLRHAPGTEGDAVAGARWVCTSCHVAQTDAPPLVGNSSGP